MTITKLKIAGENDKLGVAHYHPTFGYDKYKTKGSILINQPNAEKRSKDFYNALLHNKAVSDCLTDLRGDYKVVVAHKIIDSKEGVTSGVAVPTCYLILTPKGLIHLTHIPFKGRVTGKETSDWLLWGNARSKNFCSLTRPLFYVNDQVIKPLQNVIKSYLTKDEIEQGLGYVRSIIMFDAGSELVIYNTKKNKDGELEFLSTQVATTETVKSVVDAYYYNTNGTRRTGTFSGETYNSLEKALTTSEVLKSKGNIGAYFVPPRVELIDFSVDDDTAAIDKVKKVSKKDSKSDVLTSEATDIEVTDTKDSAHKATSDLVLTSEATDIEVTDTKDSAHKATSDLVLTSEATDIEVTPVDLPTHKVLKKVKLISGASKEDLERKLNKLLLEEDYHEVEMRGDLCSCILKQYK